MRALLVVAMLALLTTTVPHAAADVTVDQDLPGMCKGTNGVYGFWGEAWVGSGGEYAGPCSLYIFIDT